MPVCLHRTNKGRLGVPCCFRGGSARLGEIALQQGHKDGLTLGIRLPGDQGWAEMKLECAHGGAALLIPGAAWRYPIAVAGELLLPLLRIPEGEWRLAQFGHSGLVWPGADAMVKGQLAPGEVGAGILLAFGGYVAVGQHLGGGIW